MSWMQDIRDGRAQQVKDEPDTTYQINWIVFLAGLFFWYIETRYFGWNALPGSDAEVICDGIAIMIQASAIKRVPVRR